MNQEIKPVVQVRDWDVGKGHKTYAYWVREAAYLAGLSPKDIETLSWRRNGNLLQWAMASASNLLYLGAGGGGRRLEFYQKIRSGTDSGNWAINLALGLVGWSGDKALRLARFSGDFRHDERVTVYAAHPLAKLGRPGHGVVIGDTVTDKAGIDGVSTLFVPTREQQRYLLNGSGHDALSAIYAGFLVSLDAQSNELFQKKIAQIESGNGVDAAFLFTGQRPRLHQKWFFEAMPGIRNLMRDGVIKSFSVYTSGDWKLAERIARVFPEAEVTRPNRRWDGLSASLQLLRDKTVVVAMPCQWVGYNAVCGVIDLPSFNSNSVGNKNFNEANRLTVSASAVEGLGGIDKVLKMHLVDLGGREMVANMERARKIMDLGGVQRIAQHISEQPAVQERLAIRGK